MLRTHQYVSWSFIFLSFVWIQTHFPSPSLKWAGRLSCLLYFLQALPYGKAVGLGTWANLVLWIFLARKIQTLGQKQVQRTAA